MDLLLAGTQSDGQGAIKIYRNKQNANGSRSFEAVSTNIPAIKTTSCVWSDYDSDGDLDLAFTGFDYSNIYERTNNNSYELIGVIGAGNTFVPLDDGVAAWANYDIDGDLDFFLAGQDQYSMFWTKIYRNETSSPGGFSGGMSYKFPARYSSATWGDYDNDGDLDLLLTGEVGSSSSPGNATKLYRNNSTVANTIPNTPTNLSHEYTSGSDQISLQWNKSTDNQTPLAGMTFNLMVGTTPGGTEIISPMSVIGMGMRTIPAPGNAGPNDYYTLQKLSPGSYYWQVQAVDNTFKSSAFSNPAFFIIDGTPKANALSDEDGDENEIAETDSTSRETTQVLPVRFTLFPNYPNPFNPSTRINLELPESGHVRAIVYDLQGKEVFRLREGEMNLGYHVLDWDGRSTAGTAVGSGTYIVKVSFEGVNGLREEGRQQVLLVK